MKSLLITRKKYLLLFHMLASPWSIIAHRYMEYRVSLFFLETSPNFVYQFIILQELLFACAKNLTVELLQSLDQQKLSCQISSLQIDNQLRTTSYPVILSFDREPLASENSCEPVFYLAVSKWRKKDISLVSFEYISLRSHFLKLVYLKKFDTFGAYYILLMPTE